MTTQFDETTEKKAEAHSHAPDEHESFIAGRNSTRGSLEILARNLDWFLSEYNEWDAGRMHEEITNTIAAVKARGDWPLEESND